MVFLTIFNEFYPKIHKKSTVIMNIFLIPGLTAYSLFFVFFASSDPRNYYRPEHPAHFGGVG